MTQVKNITFPQYSTKAYLAYEEDPGEGDTEVVSAMSGKTYRNGRRTVFPRGIKLTLGGPDFVLGSAAYTQFLAVRAAAEGRLYGFKHVSPIDGATLDVAFVADRMPIVATAGSTIAATKFQVSVELEQVIGGTAI